MGDEQDSDIDAEIAIAVVEDRASELDANTTAQRLDLIEQLEGLRSIRAAFDALPGPAGTVRKPPPFETWGPSRSTRRSAAARMASSTAPAT